jgi:dTDP-4-amino-4,6-dideoxygalactose transaminase
MPSNKIPFVDLYAQYQSIKTDIDRAIEMTIRNSSYIGGQAIKDFEKAFAAYIGIDHVIACANGTDSIEILLKVYGIKEGDEVIVPAISWISTSEAVSSVGATPVFVDIEGDYYTMDTRLIEKAITARTKAIIPVHLYGHPADMPAIMEIAAKHKLLVIEDCAQAHGAKIDGRTVGTFGHAASFSFYPGKNLGAYGDAGCMATNDLVIAEKARMLSQHGQKGKHNHLIEGRNSRMDGLQAAILLAKLPYLEKWTEARIANAAKYHASLQTSAQAPLQDVAKASRQDNAQAPLHDIVLALPLVKNNYRHVFHLFVVRVNNREKLQKELHARGIETAIHYPVALPFLPCYHHRNLQPKDFPVAFEYQGRILSLPLFPELTDQDIQQVSAALRELSVKDLHELSV